MGLRGRRLLLAIGAALAMSSLWASSAQALETHNFISSISSAELSTPYGAAVDDSGSVSAGDLYVVVPPAAPPKVIKFDADGNEVSKIDDSNLAGCSGATDFNNPFGVAVDPTNGEVYVTDNGANTVTAFDPAGTCLFQIHEGLSGPLGVAVDPTHGANGTLYVAASGTQTIESLDAATGAPISSFSSSPGTVFSLAVDTSGDIFLARYSESVLEYDPSGNCLAGCTPIDTNGPVSVAIDRADNHLFVAGNSQITEYAPGGGSPLSTFGQGHVGGLPFGLAVNSTSGRVYASDFYASAAEIFGPLVTLPDVTTGPATNPGQTSATLTGHVDPAGGAEVSGCRFEYGTDTSYGSGTIPCEPAAPLASATDVTANLGGLTSETTYHYRLVAENTSGANAGQDATFTPRAVNALATEPATGVTPNTAQLNGSFVGNGEDTHYYFEWGADQNYGHTTSPPPGADAGSPGGPAPTALSLTLEGLTPEAEYHYRIVASNSAGTSFGEDHSFKTPPAVGELKTEAPTNVAPRSATLTGSFVGNGKATAYHFEWGLTSSYGSNTATESAGSPVGPAATPVSVGLSGLAVVTTYHYRLVATNSSGSTYGEDQTFTTLSEAPRISGEKVSEVHSVEAQLNSRINSGGAETKYHFEYATAEEYDEHETYSNSSPEEDAGSSTTDQNVTTLLDSLKPGTTYHWRLVAENQNGVAVGPDRTLSTYSAVSVLIDPCSNAHVRQQTGAAGLPDCRAYELVSAVDTGGYDVESDLVEGESPYGGYPDADGRVLYAVHDGGIPGTNNPTDRGPDPYVAIRGENGWSTKYVGVPANNPFSVKSFSSVPSGADTGLETFAFGGPGGCSPCFEGGYTGIPLHLPSGELVQGMVPAAGLMPPPSANPVGFVAKDLSPNGEHLIFGSTAKFAPGGNDSTGDVSIYDHNLRSGETHALSKTPGGAAMAGPGIAELDISNDGSRVLLGQVVSEESGVKYWKLYMNIRDSEQTLDLTPGASDGVLYDGMTSDGSTVFFTTIDELTTATNQDTDHSADIYEAEIEVGTQTEVNLARISVGAAGTGNTNGCNPVSNIVHTHWNSVGSEANCGAVAIGGGGGVASTDGTIYFLSPEKLDGASNGVQNAPNLYVARPDSPPHFVATLESSLTGPQPPVTYHRLLGNFGSLSHPTLIAVDNSAGPSSGDVYVADVSSTAIYKFDSSGSLVTSWGDHGHLSPKPGWNIGGLAVGHTGTLYVATGNCELYEYTQGGTEIALTHGVCGGPIAVDSNATLYNTGTPLAVDPSNDDLYVAPGDGSISRSRNGGPAEPFATGLGNIASLTVDAAHDVYVDEGDQVVELNSAGDEVGAPIGSGVVHNSSGIAVNSVGDVFVGNPGRSTVDEFGITEPDPLPQIVSPVVADAVSSPSARHTADFQVSRDGGFAAFPSSLSLTGFETENQPEVYRYDARSSSLACVSCNPTGVPPSGSSALASNGLSLSEDGRVFFTSLDPLVAGDGNNRRDVYEWEAQGVGTCSTNDGCIALISAGTSGFDSSLLGASANGVDAYFFSRDSLVPGPARGNLVKVYDARELGGFPYTPRQPECKASDECHGPGTPIPPNPAIGSGSGSLGNEVSGAVTKCKKGEARKHARCHRKRTSHHPRHSHKRSGSHG